MKLTQPKIQILIIITLTVLVYAGILWNQPIIDDKVFINQDYLGKLSVIDSLKGVVPAGHEGVYRPIRSLLYLLYYHTWGTNPLGYHLHSLVVHLLSTLLVYLIASRLWLIANRKTKGINDLRSATSYLPFTTALLFGVHPIHTESITYIAASMDMTGIALMLSAYLLYLHQDPKNAHASIGYVSAYLLGLLAFFTYEMTLTLPILIILSEVCFKEVTTKNWKKKLILIWPFLAGVVLYIGVRFFLIHATTRGPYLAGSFYLTMLTMSKVLVKYLGLLIWPIGQANNHTISPGIEAFVYRGYRTDAIAAQTFLSPEVLVSIIILVLILAVAIYYWRRKPLITFGIGWFFVAILPGAEIIPQGSMMNERLMYIPSIGFCLLIAYLIQKLKIKIQNYNSKLKSITFDLLLVLLTFTLCLLTFMRNMDWKNELVFWSHDIAVYPDNAYAYFQRGNAYARATQADLAIKDYDLAFRINPHFAVAIASSARVYEDLKSIDLAKYNYLQAVQADPGFWEGWFSLGNIEFEGGNKDTAIEDYHQALKANPQFSPAQNNLQAALDDLTREMKTFKNSHLAFDYPKGWILAESAQRVVLKNQIESFQIQFNLTAERSARFGELMNQGLAQVPNVDQAEVRIWKKDAVVIYQFFLTKKDRELEVIVWPGDSGLMRVFDRIIGSLVFNSR